jgi:hypothetical protein
VDDALRLWLEALAAGAVGQRVRVVPLAGDAQALGRAGWDGEAWVIRLDPAIQSGDVLHVLYHEAGHIALGHVAKGEPTVTASPAGDTGAMQAVAAQLAAPIIAAREAEAETWALERMADLSPRVRMLTELLCQGGSK